jgi:hypothetical protein
MMQAKQFHGLATAMKKIKVLGIQVSTCTLSCKNLNINTI